MKYTKKQFKRLCFCEPGIDDSIVNAPHTNTYTTPKPDDIKKALIELRTPCPELTEFAQSMRDFERKLMRDMLIPGSMFLPNIHP